VKLGDLPNRAGDPVFVCADVGRLRDATTWRPRGLLEYALAQLGQ